MFQHSKFYIGTERRILEVDMPLTEPTETLSRYGETGKYASGGNWGYASPFTAKLQEFAFARGTYETLNDIDAITKGRYGKGYIYYADPFAHNILPVYLADPGRAAIWQTAWDRFAWVDIVPTPDNPYNLPVDGCFLRLDGNGYRTVFKFVVPDDASIAVSIKGERSDDITFELVWGTTVKRLPVCPFSDGLWDSVVANTGQGRLATIQAKGNGECTLYGLMLALTNTHANVASVTRDYPVFMDGSGQSGCMPPNDEVSRTLYTLLQNWERDSFPIALLETELFN